mgnify:CR=1 FL=1|tara:strand:+ start:16 stop:297 length:282 start_codon:yes stop_codon:yes gene_type:complete
MGMVTKQGTDWIAGQGISRNGMPDESWIGKCIIGVQPRVDEWCVKIQWGTTWGHLAIAIEENFNTAWNKALTDALVHGCPEDWLPNFKGDENE